MRGKSLFWKWIVGGLLILCSGAVVWAGSSDPLYERCKDDVRAPWCYQEEVERIGDPDLCENILLHWPSAKGVHGWCYYRIAFKKKDCALCDRIVHNQTRSLCKKDLCR